MQPPRCEAFQWQLTRLVNKHGHVTAQAFCRGSSQQTLSYVRTPFVSSTYSLVARLHVVLAAVAAEQPGQLLLFFPWRATAAK
jgi:hypothetical protein